MAVCLKGTRALPLLCKRAKRCSDIADVIALIRGFLLVPVSGISDLIWRFMPRVHLEMEGSMLACQERVNVHANILREPLPADSESESADDAEAREFPFVEIAIRVKFGLRCSPRLSYTIERFDE
jgi:hypothetical protein